MLLDSGAFLARQAYEGHPDEEDTCHYWELPHDLSLGMGELHESLAQYPLPMAMRLKQ
ncbi:MAG: hypothetical protein ACI8QS_001112 [Planctomycetota bacterium]|jgi:hypothetical protein